MAINTEVYLLCIKTSIMEYQHKNGSKVKCRVRSEGTAPQHLTKNHKKIAFCTHSQYKIQSFLVLNYILIISHFTIEFLSFSISQ